LVYNRIKTKTVPYDIHRSLRSVLKQTGESSSLLAGLRVETVRSEVKTVKLAKMCFLTGNLVQLLWCLSFPPRWRIFRQKPSKDTIRGGIKPRTGRRCADGST